MKLESPDKAMQSNRLARFRGIVMRRKQLEPMTQQSCPGWQLWPVERLKAACSSAILLHMLPVPAQCGYNAKDSGALS